MQGVILAAGKGTRMGDIDTPKCLLQINEIPIIKHQINSFKKNGIKLAESFDGSGKFIFS